MQLHRDSSSRCPETVSREPVCRATPLVRNQVLSVFHDGGAGFIHPGCLEVSSNQISYAGCTEKTVPENKKRCIENLHIITPACRMTTSTETIPDLRPSPADFLSREAAMTIEKALSGLLEYILQQEDNSLPDPELYLDLTGGILRIRTFEKGEYLTHMGLPLETILIHLDGPVSVYRYSPGGTGIRGEISEPPQIYGLYEALNAIPAYGVSLQAAGTVCCAVLPPALFLKSLRNEPSIALAALSLLARFTDEMLNRHDRLTLNSPYQNLVIHLFESSVGRPLPVVIPGTKSELAALLNISSRTLYRLLDRLEEDSLIERRQGKIVITRRSFPALEAACGLCRQEL